MQDSGETAQCTPYVTRVSARAHDRSGAGPLAPPYVAPLALPYVPFRVRSGSGAGWSLADGLLGAISSPSSWLG